MAGLLIIDGYNAIHALPILRTKLDKGLEHARDGLTTMIREWRTQHPTWEVLLVYDGQSIEKGTIQNNRGATTGIKTIFTASTVEADERIKQAVRNQDPKAETIVITRDREILACCRDHGVRFESPDFLLNKRTKDIHRAHANIEEIPDKDKKEISSWYRDALKGRGSI